MAFTVEQAVHIFLKDEATTALNSRMVLRARSSGNGQKLF